MGSILHLTMEIFNVNNLASRVQRQQRDEAEQRAEKARAADRASVFRLYTDEAELDAEVHESEEAERTRALEGNDQEAAHEDRQESGYFEGPPAERGGHLDIEG